MHVGLPFISDLETLRIEVAQNGMTLQSSKVAVGEITLRVLKTRGLWFGVSKTDLIENKEEAADAYGAPTPLYTGDIPLYGSGGWDSSVPVPARPL